MAASENPLTDVHCDCLTGVCKSCNDTQQLIDKAKAAGFNMDQAEAVNKQQLEMAMRAKAAYFPDRA